VIRWVGKQLIHLGIKALECSIAFYYSFLRKKIGLVAVCMSHKWTIITLEKALATSCLFAQNARSSIQWQRR